MKKSLQSCIFIQACANASNAFSRPVGFEQQLKALQDRAAPTVRPCASKPKGKAKAKAKAKAKVASKAKSSNEKQKGAHCL